MKKSTLLITACILILIVSGFTSFAQETCEQYGTIDVAGGEYTLQNSVWGATTAQCIESTGGTGFRVSVSEHNQGSVAGYPSIYKGCHWGDCTSNSGLPVRASEMSSANFNFSVSSFRPSGDYNVAMEGWMSSSSDSSNGYSGGAEIMIILDYHGMNPAGSQIGTFNGYNVYYAEIGWNFLTYVKTGTNSASGNFMDFVNDCISRGYAQSSWYVHDFEAGFEIMSGGEGLTANSFSFSVSTGGTTTPAPTNPPIITNPPTITNPPDSGDNSVVVRARGTNGDEQIRLKIDNNTIATFNLNTSYGDYSASTNSGGSISVEFFNDGSGKDVQVDYIQVNGSTRQAEDQSSNTAVWQNSSCGGSYSEWMHCNGEIGFGDVSGGTTTPAPTSPPVITNPPTVTNPPTITNPPSSGETCTGGISKSIPFAQDGAGDYCFEIASINYINSWNMTKLTVNGVDFTNKWASNLPAKIDGLYYIVYDGNVAWCHFEAK